MSKTSFLLCFSLFEVLSHPDSIVLGRPRRKAPKKHFTQPSLHQLADTHS